MGSRFNSVRINSKIKLKLFTKQYSGHFSFLIDQANEKHIHFPNFSRHHFHAAVIFLSISTNGSTGIEVDWQQMMWLLFMLLPITLFFVLTWRHWCLFYFYNLLFICACVVYVISCGTCCYHPNIWISCYRNDLLSYFMGNHFFFIVWAGFFFLCLS